jgi:hypothetical protein
MPDNVILYGDLTVEGCDFFSLEKLEFVQKINNHSELTVSGILKKEENDNFFLTIHIDSAITINKKGEPLFTGVVDDISIKNESELYYVNIRALSYTCKMDIKKVCRSFQDKNMSYKDLVKEVIGDYEKSDYIYTLKENKNIEFPIFQHMESNWEFIKRMASRFNLGLLPHGLGGGPKFFFGIPEIDKGELVAHNYTERKKLGIFNEYKQYNPSTRDNDFIYYEVETESIYDLGDKVIFNMLEMYILESTFKYEESIIKNICTLGMKKGGSKPRLSNVNIAGTSIFGKVIKTARDNIKIHLEIDEKQDVGTAYWFPYASMYASEDETGWYCLPELSDTVRLYFPSEEESQAMAINAVKPHDPKEDVEKLDPEHRMADTNIKYMRTAFGKELKFRPDGIDIISKDGQVFMTLNDDGTVTLNSNNKISFTAANDIEIKAENINVEATTQIKMVSESSSMIMEKDIVVEGQEVKTN